MTSSNERLNVDELEFKQLKAEYELSQWALTWALKKLNGKMIITAAEMEEYNVTGRIYYTQSDEGKSTTVEFIEHGPKIVIPN